MARPAMSKVDWVHGLDVVIARTSIGTHITPADGYTCVAAIVEDVEATGTTGGGGAEEASMESEPDWNL